MNWGDLHLKVHILRFEIQARTRMRLPPFKGSTFRGAWKSHLTRAYCPASPEERSHREHIQQCPVCYLTEWESHPESRKPYAFRPPLTLETDFPPGATLSFGLVLLGPAWLLLPYVLSGIKSLGQVDGIGSRVEPEGRRGRFDLQAVYLEHPFRSPSRKLIYEATNGLVHAPQDDAIIPADVEQAAQKLLDAMGGSEPGLTLRFLTPMRLIHRGRLVRTFAFGPFWQRLLERLFMVAEDFGDPPLEDARERLRRTVEATLPVAEKVRVVRDHTWWWDVKGYSSRLGREQHLGGLIGEVLLQAPREVWSTLLIPLLWGTITHVGKNAVKGGGWYELRISESSESTNHESANQTN